MLDVFSVKKAVKLGFELFKKEWKVLVGVMLFPLLVSIVMNFVLPTTPWIDEKGNIINLTSGQIITNFLNSLVGIIIGLIISLGVANIYINAVRGNPIRFQMLFEKYNLALKLFCLQVLSMLGIFLGVILFIIPGIYLALRWIYGLSVLVDKNLGPIDSLALSWKMTRGKVLPLLKFGLTSFVLIVVGLIALIVGVIPATITIMGAYYYMYDLYLRKYELSTSVSVQ